MTGSGLRIQQLLKEVEDLKKQNKVLKADAEITTQKRRDAEVELRLWQDVFEEEVNLAAHQRGRYNTSARDARLIFQQRKKLT